MSFIKSSIQSASSRACTVTCVHKLLAYVYRSYAFLKIETQFFIQLSLRTAIHPFFLQVMYWTSAFNSGFTFATLPFLPFFVSTQCGSVFGPLNILFSYRIRIASRRSWRSAVRYMWYRVELSSRRPPFACWTSPCRIKTDYGRISISSITKIC